MQFLIVLPLIMLFSFFSTLFANTLTNGIKWITTFLTFCSLLISLSLFYFNITESNILYIDMLEWITLDSLNVSWSFCYDSLTVTMIIVVTSISTLVHLYSTEYMKEDPHLCRFMSYLSLFTFFMLILVTANNFLQMFVGWEGVGLASYLLINFWFTRIQANKSAIKAMLVNRVGDFFLLIGIFTIFYFFNSLDYDIVFSLAPYVKDYALKIGSYQFDIIDIICLLLFGGAMGKSAQIGLHTWLPDAMEGPTPVSALIHAATMVTAGVFLIIRCSHLFENSPFVLSIVTIIGALTAFFASTTGLFQNDMKKVIAYSTCSQLGYMIFACGLSNYNVGLFHLANHAFFKALLFLGAGSVIHALQDEQDMRKMGGLRKILPFSYAVTLIGSLALIGFPYLAGFYSKDIILEVSYITHTWASQAAFVLGILAAFTTAIYSTRLLFLVFLSEPNGNKNIIMNAHEGSLNMVIPLFILCILSIFIGYLTKDFMIGFGSDFWGSAIYINVFNNFLIDIEFFENIHIKLLPLYVTICGCILAFIYYDFKQIKQKVIKLYETFLFFFNKYFSEYVYFIFSSIKQNKIKFYSFLMQFINRFFFSKILFSFFNEKCSKFWNFLAVSQLKSNKFIKIIAVINKFVTFFNKKWYFDRIYNEFIAQKILIKSFNFFYIVIDRGFLEKIGPNGLSIFVSKVLYNFNISSIHTGFVLDYIIYSIYSFVCIIILFF